MPPRVDNQNILARYSVFARRRGIIWALFCTLLQQFVSHSRGGVLVLDYFLHHHHHHLFSSNTYNPPFQLPIYLFIFLKIFAPVNPSLSSGFSSSKPASCRYSILLLDPFVFADRSRGTANFFYFGSNRIISLRLYWANKKMPAIAANNDGIVLTQSFPSSPRPPFSI